MNMNTTPSESIQVDIRGLRYHVRRWGADDAPRLFLLHGWWDMSASFQFVAQIMADRWQVLAPDWRGCGLSQWSESGAYWFNDYLGDLHCLLRHFEPQQPARIVGHSMGFNVASVYAGLRPERVERLANLDCYGFREVVPGETWKRLGNWLQTLDVPGERKRFTDTRTFASLLQRKSGRLPDERALFFASHLTEPAPDGGVQLRGDPALRDPARLFIYNGFLDIGEAMDCWRHVAAPVLWVEAEQSELRAQIGADASKMQARKSCFARLQEVAIPDAGHMVHQEQPDKTAQLLSEFFTHS